MVDDIEGFYIVVPEHFRQSAGSTGTEGEISKDFSAKGTAAFLPYQTCQGPSPLASRRSQNFSGAPTGGFLKVRQKVVLGRD